MAGMTYPSYLEALKNRSSFAHELLMELTGNQPELQLSNFLGRVESLARGGCSIDGELISPTKVQSNFEQLVWGKLFSAQDVSLAEKAAALAVAMEPCAHAIEGLSPLVSYQWEDCFIDFIDWNGLPVELYSLAHHLLLAQWQCFDGEALPASVLTGLPCVKGEYCRLMRVIPWFIAKAAQGHFGEERGDILGEITKCAPYWSIASRGDGPCESSPLFEILMPVWEGKEVRDSILAELVRIVLKAVHFKHLDSHFDAGCVVLGGHYSVSIEGMYQLLKAHACPDEVMLNLMRLLSVPKGIAVVHPQSSTHVPAKHIFALCGLLADWRAHSFTCSDGTAFGLRPFVRVALLWVLRALDKKDAPYLDWVDVQSEEAVVGLRQIASLKASHDLDDSAPFLAELALIRLGYSLQGAE